MDVQGRIVTTQTVTGNAHQTFIDKSTPYTGDYTVTPSEQAQTLQTSGKRMTENVTIEAVPWVRPQGDITITQNGQHDVTDYETATVQVPQGVFPEGTLDITENGIYNVTAYESAAVNIPTPPREPVLLESVDIASLPEQVNRITLSVIDRDLSDYSLIWVEGDELKLSASDWLYFTDGYFNDAYFGQSTSRFVFNLAFFVKMDQWRTAIKGASWRGYNNVGNPVQIADISFYTYSAATKFTSGVLKLYAI